MANEQPVRFPSGDYPFEDILVVLGIKTHRVTAIEDLGSFAMNNSTGVEDPSVLRGLFRRVLAW